MKGQNTIPTPLIMFIVFPVMAVSASLIYGGVNFGWDGLSAAGKLLAFLIVPTMFFSWVLIPFRRNEAAGRPPQGGF